MEPHPILKEGGALITYSIHHTFISDLSMCNVKRIGKKGNRVDRKKEKRS
jgi:hypothetical protein